MRLLNKIFYRYIKRKKNHGNKWLGYYDAKNNTLDFPKVTIYEHLKSQIGDDLGFYALNYFGTRITYGEFFKKINRISRSLKALGVKKGDIVSICMPNTPEAVETFYAINKIGAIADMIHPLSAPNEIKHYLDESKSKVLILYDVNYDKYKDIIEKTKVEITILTSVAESMPRNLNIAYNLMNILKIKRPAKDDFNYMTWEDFLYMARLYKKPIYNGGMKDKDTAIILHSGGTTGTPKGIMISNYSFNALALQGHINVIKVQPKDKIMTILPIFHGFGLGVCVHCPLCLKVEVILIPEFDDKRFAKIIKNYKPNIIAGVPTLWEGIMSNKLFSELDLSSLKYVISGGDHLTVSMEKNFNDFLHSHGSTINVTKGYGMTESTAATAYTFEGSNIPGSVGLPMTGNQFCICKNDCTEILGPNQEGEICVCGPTIMQGYLNNKEETNKVLKKHDDGKIWLHTGDAGYIDKNGLIFFTQRIKRVIISSGFNVYPSQIEEVISTHPKVKQCCVIGIPHPYKMHVPKVYVVLNDGIKPNVKIEAELRLLCKKNLAAYALPKIFEFRDELPKTLYKKIDYKKLEEESINEKTS